MSVDTERDYTGIRCLRIGERSADSKMKETKDKTMWMWFGKHKKQIVLWSVIILIAVPLIVYGLSEISLLPVTGGNDWAGFWGGYFGSIIGGVITMIVFCGTLESNKKERIAREKSDFFLQLLNESTYLDTYPRKLSYALIRDDKELYYSEMWEYQRKVLELQLRIEIEKEKNLYIGTDDLLKKLKENVNATEKFLEDRNFEDETEKQEFIESAKMVGCTRDAMLNAVKKFIVNNRSETVIEVE